MKNRTDKMQSEFEQKLRESERSNTHTDADIRRVRTAADRSDDIVRDPDAARDPDVATRAGAAPDVIPVVEEQVRVGKRTVETGTVHISKDVREEEVTVDLPTVHEEVNVERVPINEYVDTPPPPVRYEGDVTIIPILHEELVVVKRLKVVEELHITKRRTETHETQNIVLRKEEVNVNRESLDQANPNRV
jgi:uncharacterized protein (TIGR02271 family)